MRFGLMVLMFIAFSTSWAQEPNLANREHSVFTDDTNERFMKKNIYKGNTEIEGRFNMGYGTTGGPWLNGDASIRYFLMDKIALGVSAGLHLSDGLMAYNIGPSLRAYVAEWDRFALSLNQELLWSEANAKNLMSETQSAQKYHGATGIGLHYYLSPNVALGLQMDTLYSFGQDFSPPLQSLRTVFGITFSF